MKIIKKNLIELALNNEFDVIAHGCNCFCKQKSGIAKEMVKYFKTDNFTYFPKESLLEIKLENGELHNQDDLFTIRKRLHEEQ